MKFLLAFLVCLIVGTAAHADDTYSNSYDRVVKTGVLRCGAMLWPSYFDQDPISKKISGLGVDFFDGVAKLLDIKIEYKVILQGQQIEEMKANRIDAVCNDGPYVFSAMKYLDYSHPAYFTPIYVYVNENNQVLKKFEDFNKPSVKFVGMDGDVSISLVQMRFPKATLISHPMSSEAASLMLDVSMGKVDAVYADPVSVELFNQNNKPKLKQMSEPYPVVYSVGVSVPKGQIDLLNMLNYGIDSMWNTGQAREVLKKYDPTLQVLLPVTPPYELKQK